MVQDTLHFVPWFRKRPQGSENCYSILTMRNLGDLASVSFNTSVCSRCFSASIPAGSLSTLVLTKASQQAELHQAALFRLQSRKVSMGHSVEKLRVRLASQDVAKHPFHLC